MYFYLPDKIIAATPRVASRSIGEALQGVTCYSRRSQNLYFDRRPVILFVRDPLEKFESGFRLLVHGGDILVSYDGLVDAFLDSGYDDAHLTSQRIYHDALFARDFPGEVQMYRFEEINSIWPRVVGGGLGQIGRGEGPSPADTRHRRAELLERFSDDEDLRSGL